MSYELSFVNGPEQGRQVKLRPGQTIVMGRGEDCDKPEMALRDRFVRTGRYGETA